MTDPSCLYDADTQRWFHVVLTLDRVGTTGAFTGKNHLDLAVSNTANPTGSWTIYRLPVQDDGTDGTPDHHCPLTNAGTGHGPCLGDYPHIGADANGFYITTNEYAFFPDNIFHAAQIYAFSKQALAAGGTRGRDPDRHPRGRQREPGLHGVAEHLARRAAHRAPTAGRSSSCPPTPPRRPTATAAAPNSWSGRCRTRRRSTTATPSLNLTHTVLTVGTVHHPTEVGPEGLVTSRSGSA